jgi:choline dehydrogenase-like flavoprotein
VPRLSEGERTTLGKLADLLIPSWQSMPAATAAGVHDKWVDHVLAVRPDLAPRLMALLDKARTNDPAGELARLERDDAEALEVLKAVVLGAYYMSPRVRKRLGYPGQKQRPVLPDEADYYLEEGLLDPVRKLEEPYRPSPPNGGSEAANGNGRGADIERVQQALARSTRRRSASAPADVLIVGAGASGSIAAARLASQGFKVVCLEQGPWRNADEFPGSRRTFEVEAAGRWHNNPNNRGLPEDYPCEVTEADVYPLMHNAVGGSTIHYGAIWTRMHPSDFKVRSLDGVAEDWPLSYEELAAHYEAIDVEMGISGLVGDPAYPPGAAPPLPAFPIGRIGQKLGAAMNELGWHWWPASNAMPSLPYQSRPACVRRGTCLWGCPEGAKASTDITHWPQAIRDGARLVTGARVKEITVDGQGLATGAVYIDRSGAEQQQEASIVILAANGVGTPRLLLLSRSSRFPDGLANSSGLVGRRLMLHPYVTVLGTYEEHLDSWSGPFGSPIVSSEFAETDESRGFVRGSHWELLPSGAPFQTLGMSGHESMSLAEGWGERLHEITNSTLGHAYAWGFTAEDLPEVENRVTLADGLTDSDGLPAPKIRYRMSDGTRRNLEFNAERARETHLQAGAIRTDTVDYFPDCGWHLLGTARMGTDPADSVVDPFCRAHDVPNLFIIDGSVFVTSGAVNPTATIAAIASRCTDHIIETARLQMVAA